jgi:hypothetical protein
MKAKAKSNIFVPFTGTVIFEEGKFYRVRECYENRMNIEDRLGIDRVFEGEELNIYFEFISKEGDIII